MERASRFIGFERVPPDLLHPERDDPLARPRGEADAEEARVVGRFLRAILSRSRIRLRYCSPYRGAEESAREVEPRGIIWDRDRWYLVGDVEVRPGEPRMWRADRVLEIGPGPSMRPTRSDFDAVQFLDRKWLGKAMERWRSESTVTIAMPPERAALLRKDWYYGHAAFEDLPDGRVAMSYSEGDTEAAAALLRWLGPGTELLEPTEWRPLIAAGLREMLAAY
jgi:predicted DNA-binding transcriptional regulator YafY